MEQLLYFSVQTPDTIVVSHIEYERIETVAPIFCEPVSVPGFSIHRELNLMVEEGFTPYEALESGTLKVAEYFGTTAETGTVAAGKRADLILLNANPLEDIASMSASMCANNVH